MKLRMIVSFTAFALFSCVFAEDKVNLWPEGKMPSVQSNQRYQPSVTFFIPSNRTTDACLIVAPGGAYMGVATSVEGDPVRDYFNAKGMCVAMLNYRTPRPAGLPKHLTAWQDAQRAVRIVRSQAAKRGYSPDKIGFMGFSAGGHLTLMAATSSETPAYTPIDEFDKIPCNVNWAVPVYPAYVLSDGADGCNVHGGNDLVNDRLVPEFAFDKGTPPMCLMHGDADGYAAMGSVRVYHKLRTMGIPAELHVMAKMPHVFFRNCHSDDPAALWKDRVWEWLSLMGINTAHPYVYTAPWKPLIKEYGPMTEMSYKEGTWTRDAQNVLTAHKDSPLWSKSDYSKFILDFEYKLDPGANSGVVIYCSDVKDWVPNSVEVQLLDDNAPKWQKDEPQNKNGGLYGHLAPRVNNVRPAGMWNRMTIWADGQHIKVVVNGVLTVDDNLSRWTSAKKNPDGSNIPPWLSRPWAELPTHGCIGFQGKHGESSVHLRQIRIRPL